MKYLILHHTNVSRNDAPAQFWAVNRYHKEKWNMKSSLGYYHGYTHFMGTNGVITQTRDLNEDSAHTIGYNFKGHIALCISGNFNLEVPSEAQISSLKDFIEQMQQSYPDLEIKLHRELQANRTCPGNLFTRQYLDTEIIFEQPIELEDEEVMKQKEIKRLQSKLDFMRELLNKLLNKLLAKYK